VEVERETLAMGSRTQGRAYWPLGNRLHRWRLPARVGSRYIYARPCRPSHTLTN